MKCGQPEEDPATCKDYNTICDLQAKDDRLMLVTDFSNLQTYQRDVGSKMRAITACFGLFILSHLILHLYLSLKDLDDCEKKINLLHRQRSSHAVALKEITYVCASYLIHIFFLVGYFLLALITTYKQTRLNFQVLEIYLIIMLVSDFIFAFVNLDSAYHVAENLVLFLVVKFVRFRSEEYSRVFL